MVALTYLICLDFEATCWEERDPESAEIIEFGAVLLNLQNGEIESEFHEYVLPTYRPILSEYCINLTGITQDFINRQSKFPQVYENFLNWLKKLEQTLEIKITTPNTRSTSLGRNTTFCTWTRWDLDKFLRLDCARHELELYPFLRVWIDARKIFEKVYPGKFTFDEALKHINISQAGQAHSGIDDAKTLAKMMIKLYKVRPSFFDRATDWRSQ